MFNVTTAITNFMIGLFITYLKKTHRKHFKCASWNVNVYFIRNIRDSLFQLITHCSWPTNRRICIHGSRMALPHRRTANKPYNLVSGTSIKVRQYTYRETSVIGVRSGK